MSRNVEVHVTILEADPVRLDASMTAATKEFEDLEFDVPDDLTRSVVSLNAFATGVIYGRMTGAKLAENLATAIFQANEKPCQVTIGVNELDSPPTWDFGPKDFARLTRQAP